MQIDTALIVAIISGLFTILTVVGGPVVAYFLGRGSKQFDQASQIRGEVWKELEATRTINKELSSTNQTLLLTLSTERADKARLEAELARKIMMLEDAVKDMSAENAALRYILKKHGIEVPVPITLASTP